MKNISIILVVFFVSLFSFCVSAQEENEQKYKIKYVDEGEGESGKSYVMCITTESGDVYEFTALDNLAHKIAENAKKTQVYVSDTIKNFLILKNNGVLYGLGQQYNGVLGNLKENEKTDTLVELLNDVKDFNYEETIVCAIKNDNSLWYWGYGNDSPQKIMEDVKRVSTTSKFVLIVKNDGSLWAFPKKSGLLSTPQKIMEGVKSTAEYCLEPWIIKTDDSLWKLDFLIDENDIKVQNSKKIMEDVKEAYASNVNYCVIKTDGSLWAWGKYPDYIQKPQKISDNVKIAKISGIYFWVLKEDGILWNVEEMEADMEAPMSAVDFRAFFDSEAVAETVNLILDGENQQLLCYKINGQYYLSLYDIAQFLEPIELYYNDENENLIDATKKKPSEKKEGEKKEAISKELSFFGQEKTSYDFYSRQSLYYFLRGDMGYFIEDDFYLPVDTMQRVFDVLISYDEEKNELKIDTNRERKRKINIEECISLYEDAYKQSKERYPFSSNMSFISPEAIIKIQNYIMENEVEKQVLKRYYDAYRKLAVNDRYSGGIYDKAKDETGIRTMLFYEQLIFKIDDEFKENDANTISFDGIKVTKNENRYDIELEMIDEINLVEPSNQYRLQKQPIETKKSFHNYTEYIEMKDQMKQEEYDKRWEWDDYNKIVGIGNNYGFFMMEIMTKDKWGQKENYVIVGNNIEEDVENGCMYANKDGLEIVIDDKSYVFHKGKTIDAFYSETETGGVIKFESGKTMEIPFKD